MQIVGVLDLAGGLAVHALAGAREHYAPVTSAAGVPLAPGDALGLARVYVDRLGVSELYVADLDAIVRTQPQDGVTSALASLGVPLWLDAGITSSGDARRALELGATQIIVGLETLPSFDALASICNTADRVAFSLDLRHGRPVVRKGGGIPPDMSIEAIVDRALEAGARTLVAIDLARVGTSAGVDVILLGRLRAAAPATRLVAGGGVGGWDDLVKLADVGCDAALVATALHDGRIGAADVSAARRLGRHSA